MAADKLESSLPVAAREKSMKVKIIILLNNVVIEFVYPFKQSSA